jgi:cytochrome bd-type quinol oxidase subunit 1
MRTGTMQWGRIPPQSQYALVFLPVVAVFLMGLMGAIRELARQDWHVYQILRDTTPYWFTTPLAHTSIMVGIVSLVFFALMSFIFYLSFWLDRAR